MYYKSAGLLNWIFTIALITLGCYSFAQVDMDKDGISDDWENLHQLDPTDPKDAWCDYDNDQILNLFEYQLQTDPNDNASPAIAYFTTQNTQQEFTNLMNRGLIGLTVIRMAEGTYNLFYDRASSDGAITSANFKIMIQGGWNSDFTIYDPFTHRTIFDGGGNASILVLDTRLSANNNLDVSFILEGVEMTNAGYGVRKGAVEFINWSGTGKYSVYNCSFYNNGIVDDRESNSGMALSVFWTQEMNNGEFYLVNTSIVNNKNGLYGQLASFTTGSWHIINSTVTNANQQAVLEIESTSQIADAISINMLNSIFWEDSLDNPIYFTEASNTELNVSYSNIGEIISLDNFLEENLDNATTTNIVPEFIDTTQVHFELEATSPLRESALDVGLPFVGNLHDIGVNPIVQGPIRVEITIIQPTCIGNDGEIEVTKLDSIGDLTLSLDDVNYQPELSFDNLAAGNYRLYIERQSNCQKMQIPFVLEEEDMESARIELATFCENQVYSLPDGSVVSEEGTYSSILTDENCVIEIITNLTELTAYQSTEEVSICDGQNYILPSGTETSFAGSYESVLSTAQGCDSIITTNLTITPPERIDEEATICTGESYTLPDGSMAQEEGVYFSTITGEDGCPKVVETKLTVNITDLVNTWIFICKGETYELPDGQLVDEKGTYETTLTSIYGCDSTITIVLGVNTPTTRERVSICEGGTYTLPDNSVVSSPGTYETTITQVSGCMELIETTILIDDAFELSVEESICEGSSFILPNGIEVTEAGIYETVLSSSQNCDSVVITNLTVSPSVFIEEEIRLCENGSYTLPGDSIVSTAGIYTSVLTNEQGCNSITETTILIDDAFELSVEESICEGSSFILPNGIEVTEAGIYETVLSSSQNCDSVVITNLTVSPSVFIEEEIRLCENGSYTLPGDSIVSTAGIYTSVLTNEQGCNSITETTILIDDAFELSVEESICEGSSFILPNGMEVTEAGIYETVLSSSQNCDSVVVINLDVVSIEIDMASEITSQPEGVTLQNIISSINPFIYSWSPATGLSCFDCPSPIANPNETTTYQLIVNDISLGCSASAQIKVIQSTVKPIVATAFSPNQDGVNDYLMPQNLSDDTDFQFIIYNRYSQQLFQSNSTQFGWDGYFNSQKQPVGVYVWLLNYVDSDGNAAQLNGNVTLIR